MICEVELLDLNDTILKFLNACAVDVGQRALDEYRESATEEANVWQWEALMYASRVCIKRDRR